MSEIRKAKVQISHPGGTASTGSRRYTLTLPSLFMQEFGITEDDRDIMIELKGNQLIITRDLARIDTLIHEMKLQDKSLDDIQMLKENEVAETIESLKERLEKIQKRELKKSEAYSDIEKLFKYHYVTSNNEKEKSKEDSIKDIIALFI